MNPADLFYQYYFGWTHGAGRKPIDPKRSDHFNEEMRNAYNEGYADGQKSGREAIEKASKRFGYTPSILRAL